MIDPLIAAYRDPNEDDWKNCSGIRFWINLDSDDLFIYLPKGWVKLPYEYSVIHKVKDA